MFFALFCVFCVCNCQRIVQTTWNKQLHPVAHRIHRADLPDIERCWKSWGKNMHTAFSCTRSPWELLLCWETPGDWRFQDFRLGAATYSNHYICLWTLPWVAWHKWRLEDLLAFSSMSIVFYSEQILKALLTPQIQNKSRVAALLLLLSHPWRRELATFTLLGILFWWYLMVLYTVFVLYLYMIRYTLAVFKFPMVSNVFFFRRAVLNRNWATPSHWRKFGGTTPVGFLYKMRTPSGLKHSEF